MADIIYTYGGQVYGNITNKCDCACTFCIRSHKDGVGESDNLWHKAQPTIEEIKAAIDAFDFEPYKEFVFCGYGEPTCELDLLVEAGLYLKSKHDIKIRLNTNGLGNLYNKRNIVPELAKVVDTVSISLNAPDAESYDKVTRPQFENAYEALLDFAEECNKVIPKTMLSIVDVLPEEDIKRCQEVADSRGIYLRIRKYE